MDVSLVIQTLDEMAEDGNLQFCLKRMKASFTDSSTSEAFNPNSERR